MVNIFTNVHDLGVGTEENNIYFRYVHLVDMSDIVGNRMVSKVTMFVEKL